MTDAQLFAACGGVRLGRGGRHRFFENKWKRVEEHNAETEGTMADAYKDRAKQATPVAAAKHK